MTEQERSKLDIDLAEIKVHMEYSNEIQRDYIIDRKDIYEKINGLGDRQTKVETNQKWITRIGSIEIGTLIAFFTRGYWMKH